MGDVETTVRHNVTGLVPRPRSAGDVSASARFTVLGALRVHRDDEVCPAAEGRLPQVLALLLLRAGRLVHSDSIAHEVWGDDPPADVRAGVRALVSQLRGYLEYAGVTTSGRRLLAGRHLSHQLRVEPGQVDAVVFRELLRQGQESFRAGHHDRAARLLRSGLDLWSGPALADVHCGPVLSSYVVKLEQELRTARHLRIQAEIEAGRAEDLIGELRGLVGSDPLDEGSHAQLMQVLASTGRRSEALLVYRQLRERLIDELGLEPCDDVQEQHDVLRRRGLTVH